MSIGLWSTRYSEITGQAIVTRRVAQHVLPALGGFRHYVFPATGRPVAVAFWVVSWMRLWLDIVFGKINTLYVVCSRSNPGFVRDVPALMAAQAGVHVVVHSHGADIADLLKQRWFSRLARWLYAPCDMIVPSTHMTESLNSLVKTVSVCEAFYDGNARCIDDDLRRRHNGLVVLWNSNVMASKGFFDVFAAIEHLRRAGLSIKLVCLGALVADKEMTFDALSSRFSALGNPSWFDYQGRQPHDEAVKRLNNADVIALPSRHPSESQGIAVIEAMCGGKAIVASDIPALRATLKDYPADYVSTHSVAGVTWALRRIYFEKIMDPQAFIKARLDDALKARKRFSVDRFDRQMADTLGARTLSIE